MRALLASLLLLPALAAADPGAWYADDDTLTVSTPSAGDAVWYYFPVQAGDLITATVTWDASQGAAYSGVTQSGGGCVATDVDCIVATTLRYRCDLSRYEAVLGQSPMVLTARANYTGTYQMRVAGFLVPDHLDYHLHLQVNGQAPSAVVKDAGGVLHGSGPSVCWRE